MENAGRRHSCNAGPKTDRSQICSCRYKMVEVSRPTIGLMVHRLLQSGENYADLQRQFCQEKHV